MSLKEKSLPIIGRIADPDELNSILKNRGLPYSTDISIAILEAIDRNPSGATKELKYIKESSPTTNHHSLQLIIYKPTGETGGTQIPRGILERNSFRWEEKAIQPRPF